MLDPQALRQQFPIFTHRPGLAYLDSAATALKPESVIDAERKYYEEYSANVERGLYPISEQATAEYEAARAKIARFIGADPDETVFTRGTTDSINMVATALTESIGPDDGIVVTDMEHHSNFLPWQALAERTGATLTVLNTADASKKSRPAHTLPEQPVAPAATGQVKPDSSDPITTGSEDQAIRLQLAPEGTGVTTLADFDFGNIGKHVGPDTKILALPLVSNVLGTILPIAKIVAEARRVNPGIIVLVDAAQAAAHLPIDVRALDCDFLAFSGHKCFGPTGIGVLYGKRKRLAELPPAQYGGEMVARASVKGSEWKPAPHKFEAGTPPIAQGIALGTAVSFISEIGLENIRTHEKELLGYAVSRLKETFGRDITIFGPEDIEERSGVVAFMLVGIHPHDLAHILGESDICIRAGRHCAEPLHDMLGVPATARLSVSVYNTRRDIDAFVDGVQKALFMFAKEKFTRPS